MVFLLGFPGSGPPQIKDEIACCSELELEKEGYWWSNCPYSIWENTKAEHPEIHIYCKGYSFQGENPAPFPIRKPGKVQILAYCTETSPLTRVGQMKIWRSGREAHGVRLPSQPFLKDHLFVNLTSMARCRSVHLHL